ncbi:MAG: anti-sigma factor antagonist [bacterium]|jgi:anti-anti-sigma factor
MHIMPLTASRAEQIAALGGLSMVSEREGDIHVLRLDGELELASAPRIERELRRIEATDAGVILVDLENVTFIDSTGIRLLITAAARCRGDGRLVIDRPSAAVLRVLRIAGVAKLLPLRD